LLYQQYLTFSFSTEETVGLVPFLTFSGVDKLFIWADSGGGIIGNSVSNKPQTSCAELERLLVGLGQTGGSCCSLSGTGFPFTSKIYKFLKQYFGIKIYRTPYHPRRIYMIKLQKI
jgi:hypothetical protein